MSTKDNNANRDESSNEKVPEDLAKEFEDATHSDDVQTKLKLEHTDNDGMSREKDNKTVGEVYYCPTYDCMAYYSGRNSNDHLMRKYNGYPIDDVILQNLDEMGVEKIFIGIRNSRKILEFDTQQYLDEDTFDEGWGVQRCPPQSDAVDEWPNAVGNVREDK